MPWPVCWKDPMAQQYILLELLLQKAAPNWLINGGNAFEHFLSHYQDQILLLIMSTLGNHQYPNSFH